MKTKHFLIALLEMFLILGCGKKVSEEVKIGVLLPITGPAAQYGQNGMHALDLLVDSLNKSGGINGARIRLIYGDDQADPKTAISVTNKLITVDKVVAIICGSNSSVALATAPIAQTNKVVYMASLASNPQYSKAGDYVFRNCVSDSYEGKQLAEFAYTKLGIKTVSILAINNDYGSGVVEVFKNTFLGLGGEILATELFNFNATDFRSQLSKIKQEKPKGLLLVGYREMIQVFKQLKELDLKTQVISTVMLNDPELIKSTGGASDGAVFSTWMFNKAQDENARSFVQQYKKRYNAEPDVFAAQDFDALLLISEAMKKNGVTSIAIRDGLYRLKDFVGTTGKTSFDENGDAIKDLDFKRIVSGEIKPLEK